MTSSKSTPATPNYTYSVFTVMQVSTLDADLTPPAVLAWKSMYVNYGQALVSQQTISWADTQLGHRPGQVLVYRLWGWFTILTLASPPEVSRSWDSAVEGVELELIACAGKGVWR